VLFIFRRKGENAQQVIDLSVALKTAEKELTEKQRKMDCMEAELVSLTEDIKFAEGKSRELEKTNQLLKVCIFHCTKKKIEVSLGKAKKSQLTFLCKKIF
jgi:hypothetical protein